VDKPNEIAIVKEHPDSLHSFVPSWSRLFKPGFFFAPRRMLQRSPAHSFTASHKCLISRCFWGTLMTLADKEQSLAPPVRAWGSDVESGQR
jgi:hypothetical protein